LDNDKKNDRNQKGKNGDGNKIIMTNKTNNKKAHFSKNTYRSFLNKSSTISLFIYENFK
jgi:hypothetical protein